MEKKTKERGIYGKTNLVIENQINNANNLKYDDDSKNSVAYSDECNTPCFINSSMKDNNKKRIKIKIGSNSSDNKIYTEKKDKSFIKNIVQKIEEAYKNRGKNNTKCMIPSKYNSTFYLNEYLNVEPTNNVLYRRRIPNETLYKSDFNKINLKPFIRCNSLRNLNSNNNEGPYKNNKAIIKISNVSPFEVLARSNANNSSKYFQPCNFYCLNKPDHNFNVPKIPRTHSLHNTKITQRKNAQNEHNENKIGLCSLNRRNTYNSFGNPTNYNNSNKETNKIRLHISNDNKENNRSLVSKRDSKQKYYDHDSCLSSNNSNESKYHKKNKNRNEKIKTHIFIPSNTSKNDNIKNENKDEHNMVSVNTNRHSDATKEGEELCSDYGSSDISFREPSKNTSIKRKNIINGIIKCADVDTKIDRNKKSECAENDTMVSSQYENEHFDTDNKSEGENRALFYNKRKEMDDNNKLCLYKQKDDSSLYNRFDNDKNTSRSYEDNSFNSEDDIYNHMSNTTGSSRTIDNGSNRENSKLSLKMDGKKEKRKLNNIENCNNFYIFKGEMLNILDYKEIKEKNSKSNHSSLTNSKIYTRDGSDESDIYYSDDDSEMNERFKNLKTNTISDNINRGNSKKCTNHSQRKLKTNSQNKLNTNRWNDRNSQKIMICDRSVKNGKSLSPSTKSYRNMCSDMRCKKYSQTLGNDEIKSQKSKRSILNELLPIENDDYQSSDKSENQKQSHTSKQSRSSKYQSKGHSKSIYSDKDNHFLNNEKSNKHEYRQTRSKNIDNSIYHTNTKCSNKSKKGNYDRCKSNDNSILKTSRNNTTHKSSNTHLTCFDEVEKDDDRNYEICEYNKESTNNLLPNEKKKVYKTSKVVEGYREGRFPSNYNLYKKNEHIQNKSMNSENYKDYDNVPKYKEKKEIRYSSHYSGDSKRNKKKQSKLHSNNTYYKNCCKRSGTACRAIKSVDEIYKRNISNSSENSEYEYKKPGKNENSFKSKNSLKKSKIGMKGISSNYINEKRNIYVSNILDDDHEENKQNKTSSKEFQSSRREYKNTNKKMSHLNRQDSMNFNPVTTSNKHSTIDNIQKDRSKMCSNLNINYMSKEKNIKSVCESSHNSPNDSIYYDYKNKPRRNLKSMYDVKNEAVKSRHENFYEYNGKKNISNANYKSVENSNKVENKSMHENSIYDRGISKKSSRNRSKNYVSSNHINSNNSNSCNIMCLEDKQITNDIDINIKYKKDKTFDSDSNKKNKKKQRRRDLSRFVENSHYLDSNNQDCKSYKNKYDKISSSKMGSMTCAENENSFQKNNEYIDLYSKKNRSSKNYTTISYKDDNSKNGGEKISSKINEEKIIYYTDISDSEKSKRRHSKRDENFSKIRLSNYSDKNSKSNRSIKRTKSMNEKINKTDLNSNDVHKESVISNRNKTNEFEKEQLYNSNKKNRETNMTYYSNSENEGNICTDLNVQKQKSRSSQISNSFNRIRSKSKEKTVSKEININGSYIIDKNCRQNENNNEKDLEKCQDNNSLRNMDNQVVPNKPSIKLESKCSENEVLPITFEGGEHKNGGYNNCLTSDDIKDKCLYNNKYKENLSETNNSGNTPTDHAVLKNMSMPCENNNVERGISNFQMGPINGVIGLNKANEYMREELNYYLSNNNNDNNLRKLPSIQVSSKKVITEVITKHDTYEKDKEDTFKKPSPNLNNDKSFTNAINHQSNMCISNNGTSTENLQNKNSPLNNIPIINNNSINRKFIPMNNKIDAPKSCVLPFEQNNSFQENGTKDIIKHTYSNPEIEEKKNEILYNHGNNIIYEQNMGNNGMASYDNLNTNKNTNYFGQGKIVNTNEVSNIHNNKNNIIYDNINNCYMMNRNVIKNPMINQTQAISEPINPNYGRNFYSAYYNNKAFSVPNIGTQNMNIPIYNNQVPNIIDNNKMGIIAGTNQPIQQTHPQDFRKFGTYPVIITQNPNSSANNNIKNNNPISNDLEKLNTDKFSNNKYFFYENGQAYIIGDNKVNNPSLVKSMSSYAVPNSCPSYKNI
ncbi:conserved Plasmodium protein, unknown function [Plasmodium vinckei vinckei]|uniref:Uncharacterized protein n=1 Tax=Plasmodium vinckei vinckei TaxID=54757 RepID=A0A449BT08_PLAVN|nr:conserved Plasmodium protein, unknown function [Plasmodium vinckei vinckei]KEG02339.1 hypothetical protein YYE_03078 [Plasmodium vinckei vinckei]VEV56584.1 conserved Plasmodium protein, unknown function [Plasmodium vinckei vinckei]